MKLSSVYKGILSICLFVIFVVCFTFNAFAIDMPMLSGDPGIIIDGKDTEGAWMEGCIASFPDSSNVADAIYMQSFSYCNTVYGFINFIGVKEADNNLVARVDFTSNGKTGYVMFDLTNQSVIYGDDSFLVEGALIKAESTHFMEFSFTTKYGAFKQGDVVKLEVGYGYMIDGDDYHSMRGFANTEAYEYYTGGKLPDKVQSSKPQGSSGGSTNKTTKPSIKNTTESTQDNTTASTRYDVQNFINEGFTDATETTVIISAMVAGCIVMMIIFGTARRSRSDDGPRYTDDDKGCD